MCCLAEFSIAYVYLNLRIYLYKFTKVKEEFFHLIPIITVTLFISMFKKIKLNIFNALCDVTIIGDRTFELYKLNYFYNNNNSYLLILITLTIIINVSLVLNV